MTAEQSAADVFGLLSDETRVDVLRAIAEAQLDAQRGGPAQLSFSEVYDRVDVDNTSKLSYHLGELTGTFVLKDETGYSFTHAGEHIVRFILAENYEEPRDFGPEPVDGVCPFCGATTLAAGVNHQYFLVECGDCDRPVAGHGIAPAQARDRDNETLVESLRRKHTGMLTKIQGGLCPACDGPLSTTVVDTDEIPTSTVDPFNVTNRCEECLRRYNAPMSYSVAYHPASIAFHWDRGVDITDHTMWEFHRYSNEGNWSAERLEGDPEEYQVTYAHDDDILRFRLDESADVVHTERVHRAGGSAGRS